MDQELKNLIVQKYRTKAGLSPEVPKIEVVSKENKHYHRGYYTGAFDILQIGHAAAISAAADMCDQLIIAVSTDDVIRGYKHHEPAVPYEHRSQLVQKIAPDALVIPQYDLYNKLEVCIDLGCDVIFSCEEYTPEYWQNIGREMTEKEIAGVERWQKFEKQANAHGIDVVYLPRIQGISSTQIKDNILDTHVHGEEPASLLCSVMAEDFTPDATLLPPQNNFVESATL